MVIDQELEYKKEEAENNIDQLITGIDQRVKSAESKINSELTKLARKFLLNNYTRSGLKTRTGKLKNALASSNVVVSLGKNPNIKIIMPSGLSNYEDGSNVYEVASSLNYGAVHNINERNKKRKRSIKKAVQRNSKKKKMSDTVVAQGHILTGAKKTKKGSTKFGGGSYVTKAYNFWELSSSQMEELKSRALEIFNEEVYGKD